MRRECEREGESSIVTDGDQALKREGERERERQGHAREMLELVHVGNSSGKEQKAVTSPCRK